MAFNVAALTNYVKEDADLLVLSSLFDAKTQKIIQEAGNVMTDVKSSETVNIMDTDANFQDDSGCGFNASGSTVFTQRTLTVGKIKVQEALCPKDLETKYLQKKLPKGSTYTEAVFAKEYVDRKTSKVAAQLEVAIWQGDTASGSQNINKFDGFQKIIDNAAGVVDANVNAWTGAGVIAAITAANVMSVVKAVKNAIPATVMGKEDVLLWCGWDVFNLIVDAHVSANLFAYGGDSIKDGEFVIPGTHYRVVAVHGLDGTGDLYALRTSNMFLGTDLLGEENSIRMWYSEDDMNVKFHLGFKFGVQVAFPAEIVKFKSTI